MQLNFEDKSAAYIAGYHEWMRCHCNNLAKPDNPYTEQLLNDNRESYDQWEEGWIDASFGND